MGIIDEIKNIQKVSDYNTVIAILNEIQLIIDYDPNTLKVLNKTTHLYTLFTLTYLMISQQTQFTDAQKQSISQFYQKYLDGLR